MPTNIVPSGPTANRHHKTVPAMAPFKDDDSFGSIFFAVLSCVWYMFRDIVHVPANITLEILTVKEMFMKIFMLLISGLVGGLAGKIVNELWRIIKRKFLTIKYKIKTRKRKKYGPDS